VHQTGYTGRDRLELINWPEFFEPFLQKEHAGPANEQRQFKPGDKNLVAKSKDLADRS
jgi:hypothetical protein